MPNITAWIDSQTNTEGSLIRMGKNFKKCYASLTNNCVQVEGVSSVTNCSGEVISMFVVPIKIRYQNTGNELNTYALLDNFSQGEFIRRDIVLNLGASGYETQTSLKTLDGNETHSTFEVQNLEVASNGRSNKQLIKLPKNYTTEELPVKGQELLQRKSWQNSKTYKGLVKYRIK